jgi:predicted AAA+ superfamily ATPase
LDQETRQFALRWALTRGSRSGRVAWQFARDWVGRQGIDSP